MSSQTPPIKIALGQLVKVLGFSHILIACGAGISVFITGFLLGLGDMFYGPAIFISTCTGLGYSLQRVIKARFFPLTINEPRLEYLNQFGGVLIMVWGGLFIASVFFAELNLNFVSLLAGVALGIAGLSYAILPKRFQSFGRALREFPYAKLPTIALIWGAATVFLPLVLVDDVVELNPLTLAAVFMYRVFYIGGLTLPFDVRDLEVDSPLMKTIPQVMGVKTSLLTATCLIAISAIITGGLVFLDFTNPQIGLSLLAHSLVSMVFVGPWVIRKTTPEFYFSIVLDGLLCIQIGALLFL